MLYSQVQELLRSHQSQNANYSKDQEKLGQLHKAEVDSLSERVEELKQDKKRLVEEYEAKLNKAQAFYERELEAMKRTQQMTAENLLAWKKTEAELRKEFQAQEAALQKTLAKLRSELQRVQEEARESREKSHKLQVSLIASENNIKVKATRCITCPWTIMIGVRCNIALYNSFVFSFLPFLLFLFYKKLYIYISLKMYFNWIILFTQNWELVPKLKGYQLSYFWYLVKSLFAKTDNIFKNHVFYYVIMFLLCFIVLVSCFLLLLFFKLVKKNSIFFEINWNAQWKNMISENCSKGVICFWKWVIY